MPLERLGVKDRADDEDQLAVPVGFIAQRPLHADQRADDLRAGVAAVRGVGDKLVRSAEDAEGAVEHVALRRRAGGGDKAAVGVIAPDIEFFVACDQTFEQKQVLLAFCH